MADGENSANERVLLVEGPNDMHVVRHLWFRYHQADPEFYISVKNNVEALIQDIRGEILSETRTVVGILVDADDYPANRWRAVSDRIREAGIAPPNKPISSGTIIEGNPRIGVWMMPDNQLPGELEDFIEKMIPSKDPVWPLSEAYIDGIPQTARKFSDGKILKAKVYAWLAAREEPRLMGTAIRAGDLSVNVPASADFVNWLRRLFN